MNDLPMTYDDRDFWHEVYDILVEHAGASPTIDGRGYFVHSQPYLEYRFMGFLGFGGKFWVNNGRIYVSCYTDDNNPERVAIIRATNDALSALLDLRFPKCSDCGRRPRDLPADGVCQECSKERSMERSER